jgi:hypothetical protein
MKGVLLPRVALAALGLVLAAAGALAQQATQPAAQTIPQPAAQPAATSAGALSADLGGTACRWEARTDVPIERGVPQAANIYCGDAKHPTGTVSATLMPINLPADDAARHQALERAAADTPVGREDAARMSCTSGKWDKSGAVDLGIQQCALASGRRGANRHGAVAWRRAALGASGPRARDGAHGRAQRCRRDGLRRRDRRA